MKRRLASVSATTFALLSSLPGLGKAAELTAARSLAAAGRREEALALLQSAANRQRPRAEICFRLGWALEQEGQREEAVQWLERAINIDPDHARAHFRLGRIRVRPHATWLGLQDLERAAELTPRDLDVTLELARTLQRLRDPHGAALAFRRALALEPDRADILSGLAGVLTAASSLESVDLLERAARLEPTADRWNDVALLLQREDNPTGAARAWMKARRHAPADPGLAASLAKAFESGNHWVEAITLREHIAQAQSHDPDALAALAEAYLGSPNVGLAHHPGLGLVHSDTGRVSDALVAIERAVGAAPERPDLLRQAATVYLLAGREDLAAESLTKAFRIEPSPATIVELGKVLQSPRLADLPAAADAYEAALNLAPRHRQATVRLLGVAARSLDWNRGWSAGRQLGGNPRLSLASREVMESFGVLFHPRPEPSAVADLVERLVVLVGEGEPIDSHWLRFVAARLGAVGAVVLGFDVKEAAALRVLQETQGSKETFDRVEERVRALIYLERIDEALSLVDRKRPEASRRSKLLAWEKLTADAHLASGSPDRLIAFASHQRHLQELPGDQRMVSLVRNRSVVVVGPSAVAEQNGDTIDAYETVVRPRHSREFLATNRTTVGSRTDISYYSGRDITGMEAEVVESLDDGSLKLAVARPIAYRGKGEEGDAPVRYYRHEYGMYLMGGPLGIQRAVYDLMQFEPSELAIYNTDFYAGSEAFAEGYRPARDCTLSAASVLADIFVSHDLRADFQFTRSLYRSGLVHASPEVAAILDLETPDYLSRVQHAGALGPVRN